MTRIAAIGGRWVARLAAVACLLAPATARPAHSGGAAAPSPTRPAGRAGLLVEVDPPTGETAPPIAGADGALPADGDPSLARSTDGLELQMLPGGSRRVDLQGRFRSYSVVTIAADGTLWMACADDQAAALALARAAASLAPAAPAPRAAFGPREE